MFPDWNKIYEEYNYFSITLLWRRSLSYRNQSIDLQSKSMDLFLYDRDLRHEKDKLKSEEYLNVVKTNKLKTPQKKQNNATYFYGVVMDHSGKTSEISCSNKVLITNKKSYCSFCRMYFVLFSMYQPFTGFWRLVSDASISDNCFVVASLRFFLNSPKET